MDTSELKDYKENLEHNLAIMIAACMDGFTKITGIRIKGVDIKLDDVCELSNEMPVNTLITVKVNLDI